MKVLVVDVENGRLPEAAARHLHAPVEPVVATEANLRAALSKRDYRAVVASREAAVPTNALLAEIGEDVPCITATPESLPRVRSMLCALDEPVLPGGEDFYRWLMELGNVGVWVIDATGHTRFVNPALANMFHTTPAEMKGHSILDFLDEDQHAVVRERRGPFKDGKRLVAEYRYRRPDGTYFTGLLESTPLFEGGAFAGGIAMVMDISEWRASEERVEAVEAQLRQSQKMEAVGRLAGGIAHDFNNMLSVILGYGDSLLDRVKNDPQATEDLEEILAAGNRACELTRQLLLFSRRHVVQRTIVDLAELVSGMQKMLERMVGEDVEILSTPYSGHEPPLVLIDRSGIETVILNLVVNARDAMPSGGRLAITLEERGSSIVMRVRDSGQGMDEATLARAFDPFFTTKDPGKGSGLGLSTAYGIIQQAGGTIHIESAVGQGTAFVIELPRTKADAVATAPARPARELLAPRVTILLVEDEDQVRAVARRALERYGHRVIEARTPMEALDLTPPFELLLTDVIMPQMSGAELARRLLAVRPSLKVVFMSGYTDDHLSAHGVESGSASYLQKPFSPADLSKKIREVLEGA